MRYSKMEHTQFLGFCSEDGTAPLAWGYPLSVRHLGNDIGRLIPYRNPESMFHRILSFGSPQISAARSSADLASDSVIVSCQGAATSPASVIAVRLSRSFPPCFRGIARFAICLSKQVSAHRFALDAFLCGSRVFVSTTGVGFGVGMDS